LAALRITSIKVPTQRIDRLFSIVAELISVMNRVLAHISQLRSSEAEAVVRELSVTLTSLYHVVSRMRLLQ